MKKSDIEKMLGDIPEEMIEESGNAGFTNGSISSKAMRRVLSVAFSAAAIAVTVAAYFVVVRFIGPQADGNGRMTLADAPPAASSADTLSTNAEDTQIAIESGRLPSIYDESRSGLLPIQYGNLSRDEVKGNLATLIKQMHDARSSENVDVYTYPYASNYYSGIPASKVSFGLKQEYAFFASDLTRPFEPQIEQFGVEYKDYLLAIDDNALEVSFISLFSRKAKDGIKEYAMRISFSPLAIDYGLMEIFNITDKTGIMAGLIRFDTINYDAENADFTNYVSFSQLQLFELPYESKSPYSEEYDESMVTFTPKLLKDLAYNTIVIIKEKILINRFKLSLQDIGLDTERKYYIPPTGNNNTPTDDTIEDTVRYVPDYYPGFYGTDYDIDYAIDAIETSPTADH